MPDEPATRVTAIDHVGIAVPDLDEAIEFYRSTFGLEVAVIEVNEAQGVREAMMRVPGDDGTGTAIQLLAPLTPDSTIGKFLARNGPGLQQLAYRVADVEQASDGLRSDGLKVLYDAPRHGTQNSRTNFVHPKSAGGVLVELVEPAAGDQPAQ
ncbi:MAG: methylmalonyl-CoA epimerase [Kibdelosporangium sp.]